VLKACKEARLKFVVTQRQIYDVDHIYTSFARIKTSLKYDPVIDVTLLNAKGFA
jgi:hypothetical protein